jgi:dihydrofolate reductase
MLSAIAVIGQNRELGRKNQLIFQVPGDLPRFRQITTGHPIIMGRKTFESIGRVLPGRTNIVITRQSEWEHEGVLVVDSLEEAIKEAGRSLGSEEIFVIGGGEIFALAINLVERLYLTVVEESESLADSFFPDYSDFSQVVGEELHKEGGLVYRYLTLERV